MILVNLMVIFVFFEGGYLFSVFLFDIYDVEKYNFEIRSYFYNCIIGSKFMLVLWVV